MLIAYTGGKLLDVFVFNKVEQGLILRPSVDQQARESFNFGTQRVDNPRGLGRTLAGVAMVDLRHSHFCRIDGVLQLAA